MNPASRVCSAVRRPSAAWRPPVAWLLPVTWLPILLLAGCGPDGGPDPEPAAALDLAEPLGPGEVRAGRITDEASLFGGISAEGRVGDFKIYNDRVQFVIQSARPGSYYVGEGGTVIDADIVRPDGQPGRDMVDEWGTMYGFGRVAAPDRVEVVHDGRDGAPAVIRATGHDVPLALLEGALELPGLVPQLGLEVTTDYILRPDDRLLEVRSTVTAADGDAEIAIGDVIMGAPEVADHWSMGIGMGDEDGGERLWTGYVGSRNDLAVAIVAAPGESVSASGLEAISGLVDLVVGFAPTVAIPAGESTTWTRYYGVGADLATVSDAALARHGVEVETVEGGVEADDGPVAGARVSLIVDGAPYTVAFTDEAGGFAADVPAGSSWTLVADGRGESLFTDLPEGAAPYSPHAAEPAAALSLESITAGAPSIPRAAGRGVATGTSPLRLGVPRAVDLVAGDVPFTAWIVGRDDPEVDEAVVLPRVGSGFTHAAWARDGDVRLELEPGTYDLVAHRGLRFEAASRELVVEPGDGPITVEVPEVTQPAFDHPGWVFADPHAHSSPSGDGGITMEDRLVVTAAAGLQLHFGTDHDQIADYRPVLDALGLGDRLVSVVAEEVSPTLRGHLNIYPVTADPEAPNLGAYGWWAEIPPTTADITDALRADHGEDFIIQSNHPWSSGLAEAASWSTGIIGDPDRWTEDFQAVEVLNDSKIAGFEFYLDLINRGHAVTPVGVSDSHDHFEGPPGISGTFVAMADVPAAYSDEALIEAFRAGRTIVSRGAFLDLSVQPGTTLAAPTTLEVTARSASWAPVDRLVLYQDGLVVETVEGTSASFLLDAPSDASFVVVAESDTPMQPVVSHTAWAMSAAIKLDVDGGGWTPPLPPFR